MKLLDLIDALKVAADATGDVEVTMGWTENGQPGPVVAFKIYPDDRIELRCERET